MDGCTLRTLIRAPDATETSLFKPVTDEDWITGNPDGAVTIVEYADFQCPECAQLAFTLARLEADFPEDMRLVYRHFPLLTIHDKAGLALAAAEAAGAQGEFWAMHDLLFARQSDWANLPAEAFSAWAADRAEELGLNRAEFAAAMESAEIAGMGQQAVQSAVHLQLRLRALAARPVTVTRRLPGKAPEKTTAFKT